jgi:hypothetical protein
VTDCIWTFIKSVTALLRQHEQVTVKGQEQVKATHQVHINLHLLFYATFQQHLAGLEVNCHRLSRVLLVA